MAGDGFLLATASGRRPGTQFILNTMLTFICNMIIVYMSLSLYIYTYIHIHIYIYIERERDIAQVSWSPGDLD